MAETVFVTGGTGFIGAHLLLQLAECGYVVKALKRENSSTRFFTKLLQFYQKEHLATNIEWVEGDLNDAFHLKILMTDSAVVYHCAGKVSFHHQDWDQLLAINKHGTANVVNAALEAGVKKFCLFSSVAALDMSLGVKGKKTDWKHFRKAQPYGYSKYLSELEALRGQEEGLDVRIIRPAVVLGPSDVANPLNRFIGRLRRGINYYPLGTTGYINVKVLCEAAIKFMENKQAAEQLILCSANIPFRETMNEFCEAGKFNPPKKLLNGLTLKGLKAYIWFAEKLGIKQKLSASGLAALCNQGGYDTSLTLSFNNSGKESVLAGITEAVQFYNFQKKDII